MTLTSGYHTSVEHSARHRRSGASQNDHGPLPHRGGERTRPNKTTQEEGESNKAKQEEYPLDRQGDTMGPGGVGGCSSPASYIHTYIHTYVYIYIYVTDMFMKIAFVHPKPLSRKPLNAL